ncbi:hypothetical protein SAMN02910358_00954 [Lachnospiraceae bacterium XBB1006]|nr:hypothetical protein SAMN02910358_00954 [Lachnospiraceae bacterium XBB1006]
MKYRVNKKNGQELSILGYGCMRFARKGGSILQEKAEEELKLAYDAGVNYFDTAYIYPGSEVALGKFLSKGYRQKVYVADKLPHYLVKKEQDIEKFFQEMLERLQTDYIDYFLVHMLNDVESFERICKLGMREWIAEKKQSGAIRNIGFSFHGNTAKFKEIVDAYDWDFCQVQFNYMDEHSQAGIEGIRYAAKKDLPVIIMEPLRGGQLVKGLPEHAKDRIRKHEKGYSAAEWGLRWIYQHEEVTVVLSGMNEKEQVLDNLRVASDADAGSFDESDAVFIEELRKDILKQIKVPCTGCGYCQPCPAGVDIPACFTSYNMSFSEGRIAGMSEYLKRTTMKKNRTNASLCLKCGKCEQHCPQGLPIRQHLSEVKRRMETPAYKVIAYGAKHFGRF